MTLTLILYSVLKKCLEKETDTVLIAVFQNTSLNSNGKNHLAEIDCVFLPSLPGIYFIAFS